MNAHKATAQTAHHLPGSDTAINFISAGHGPIECHTPANAELIRQAFIVFGETDLSPKQLSEERDSLLFALTEILALKGELAMKWEMVAILKKYPAAKTLLTDHSEVTTQIKWLKHPNGAAYAAKIGAYDLTIREVPGQKIWRARVSRNHGGSLLFRRQFYSSLVEAQQACIDCATQASAVRP